MSDCDRPDRRLSHSHRPSTSQILRLPMFAVLQTIGPTRIHQASFEGVPPDAIAPVVPVSVPISKVVGPLNPLARPSRLQVPRGEALAALLQERSEYLTRLSVRALTEADFAELVEDKSATDGR